MPSMLFQGRPHERAVAAEAVLPFDRFSAELRALGLEGRTYDPPEFVSRLGRKLGICVRVEYLEDLDNPRAWQRLLRNGFVGCVHRDPGTEDALILVPRGLGEVLRAKLIYHEAGHVAAGHPIPVGRLLADGAVSYGRGTEDRLWYPEARLALAPPARDEEDREKEARVRAEYAFAAGLYGRGVRDRATHRPSSRRVVRRKLPTGKATPLGS